MLTRKLKEETMIGNAQNRGKFTLARMAREGIL